ncbi:MAG: GFA family protein [Cyanobacteria bacterium J06635_1]
MLQGGCYCGAIRYQASGSPFHETHCHCSVCRRTSGAPFVTWFSAAKSGFKFTSGTPTRFKSTARGSRTFCPHCGTPLTCELDDFPDEIDVTTCSLDNPEQLLPKDHTWVSRQLHWISLSDGLPVYKESRHEG